MTITYAVTAGLALLLLLGYCLLMKQKDFWLLLLYICISVVNIGYFLLSISKTLAFALFANKFAYFGSVFLSLCMLMTILKLCGFTYRKHLPVILSILALGMFGVICTTGILPWYYKDVKLVFVDGAATLEKQYGVLHPLYMVYLLLYFGAMIAAILHSGQSHRPASRKHAVLMACVVLGNIFVWFVEKFIPGDFEFLSLSYLFSEVVLLALYWMMQDYVRVDQLSDPEPPQSSLQKIVPKDPLTTREQEILELILQNKKRKEIAELLCLSENTIKTHTRTLYNKLGVCSREELYALQEK